MIIHILGPSGSGKTTLGNKCSKLKNTVIIDTDDIDDPNSLKLLPKYDLKNKSDVKKFEKELGKLNKKKLEKIIEKEKNKNIIFVGFPFVGMNIITDLVDIGFQIKIDASDLYRQYNERTNSIN